MCGIVGVMLADPESLAVPELLEGCHYLQHRGQDAAGIMTSNSHGRLYQCKGNGMVRDVFQPQRVKGLVGSMGIGHLRYPTAGTSSNSEAQPFYVNSPYGLAIAHNGNLTNSEQLQKYMDDECHRHINTDSDSELLLNLFASKLQDLKKRRVNTDDLATALKGVYQMAEGAFACAAMVAGYGIIGFRDSYGIRPLVWGSRQTAHGVDYMMASENVVLEALGYSNVVDVLPGQAIIIAKNASEPVVRQIVPANAYTPCIFEYVYFARPDSVIDGISVYQSRLAMGRALARNIVRQFGSLDKVKKEVDVVIPVPDTANSSALATSAALKVLYREGFVKNRYVGRTFIMPNQSERRSSVRRKLNANPHEFKDKNVLIVDDSIVRGTTSLEIVQMARDAGAKKVYFASCAPPIRFNHIYGIDLADSKALVAFGRSGDEIAKEIGCDGLFYQTVEDMCEAVRSVGELPGLTGFEIGVFTGEYITGVSKEYFANLESARNDRLASSDVKSDVDIGIFNHAA